MSFWRKFAFSLLAIGISTYLLVILLKNFEFERFVAIATSVPTRYLIFAFCLYVLLGWWRAQRFKILLGYRRIPSFALFCISLVHNLLYRTFPLWTGELSYIGMTKHYLNIELEKGFGSLFGARAFELFFVLTGGILGLLFTSILPNRTTLVAVFSILLLISFLGIILAGPITQRIAGVVQKLSIKFADMLSSLAGQLKTMRNPKTFMGALIFSVFTYGTSLVFDWILLRTVGVQENAWVLLAIISIVMLTSAIPFHISGLGLIEGSWTFGLVKLAGLPMPRAVTISFFLHGCQILCAILSGAIGYLGLQFAKRIK